jgi:geranylgeranyl diphosphate synthase, type I
MAERLLELEPASPPGPALLHRYAETIDDAMRRAAPSPRSLLGRMASYHLGYCGPDGRPARFDPGKRIRAALCLWACDALGGEASRALPAAVAVELVHNFTLIHDDIQDGDEQRRHRETVWSVWGMRQGINAGDGMHAMALRLLLAPGRDSARRMRAAHLLSAAIVEVVEGQCLDLALEGSPAATRAMYLRLVRAKTGALMGASLAAGAVLAGAGASTVRAFDSAGRLLGLAFQTRDDWLGVWGDPSLTGKGRTGDLRRRKLTCPVVAAYEVAPPQRRRELRRLFGDSREGGEFRLRALLDELGGPELTAGVPFVLARDAIALLGGCNLTGAALEEFADLAIHVADRDR